MKPITFIRVTDEIYSSFKEMILKEPESPAWKLMYRLIISLRMSRLSYHLEGDGAKSEEWYGHLHWKEKCYPNLPFHK